MSPCFNVTAECSLCDEISQEGIEAYATLHEVHFRYSPTSRPTNIPLLPCSKAIRVETGIERCHYNGRKARSRSALYQADGNPGESRHPKAAAFN
jgi:hypothetical protein